MDVQYRGRGGSYQSDKEAPWRSRKILNPRDYDEDPDFAELKRRKGLVVCFKLIDQTECVVFQRFHLPRRFKSYVLEYLECADEYRSYRAGLVDYARDVPDKLQQLVTNKASIVTPGVAKEVNYALKVKTVYELVRGKLKPRNKRLRSDFKEPTIRSTKLLTFSLKSIERAKKGGYGHPFGG
ncbi:MAG: hypothetical protein DSO01_07910 [Archaeoglobi archaeon]|jgi:hypothetical protein|nr:MAG: hypothetical protein DSO01_07910 [Archaeoglobi archaeon]